MFNTEEGPGAEGENCKHLHAADSQPASHEVAVLVVFWDCLLMIGLFYC